jgi:hypothetical protein
MLHGYVRTVTSRYVKSLPIPPPPALCCAQYSLHSCHCGRRWVRLCREARAWLAAGRRRPPGVVLPYFFPVCGAAMPCSPGRRPTSQILCMTVCIHTMRTRRPRVCCTTRSAIPDLQVSTLLRKVPLGLSAHPGFTPLLHIMHRTLPTAGTDLRGSQQVGNGDAVGGGCSLGGLLPPLRRPCSGPRLLARLRCGCTQGRQEDQARSAPHDCSRQSPGDDYIACGPP